jgi:predicted regulator of amino acid metabolism with ACT domain
MLAHERGIWSMIESNTRRRKAQAIILRKMLEIGIRVGSDRRYYSEEIEIPDISISRALNVDRRVVRQTADLILSNPNLVNIFTKLTPITFFKDVAHYFGFTVIIVTSQPERPGIISEVTSIIAKNKLIIRQAVADDPELNKEPKLTLIIEGEVPSEVISELQNIKVVRSLTIVK